MTGFFLALCTLLSNILNPIILMLMIFELGLGVIVGWQLVRLRKEINRLNASGRRRNQKTLREGRGKLTTTFESISEKDWNDFDAFLGQYQRDLVTCSFFSLLIQIFPLLGILGTVAGLYIAINNGQDIYTGVKFALSSTVYGIIAAVIFKIADIIFTARFLNYIDDGIDRFEKNYNVVSQEAQADRTNAAAKARKPAAKAEARSSAAPRKTNGGDTDLPEVNPKYPEPFPSKKDALPYGPANVPSKEAAPLYDSPENAAAAYPAEDPSDPDDLLFPTSESLKRGQADAKNVADMISGWRKNTAVTAGGETGGESRPED